MTIRELTFLRPLSHLAMLGAIALSLSAPAVAADAQRIVSVGGAATEVLYRLGVQDRVVGVDSTSLYPAEARDKPDVGYIRSLSAEGILSLSPDLIILEEASGPPETVAIIDKAGLKVAHVPSGYDLGGVPQKIRDIAAAVGKSEDGNKLAAEVDAELVDLKNRLAGVKTKKRVLFILSLVDGRPMAAGTHTAANGIIELAGAENVFADVKGYKTLSPEAAAAMKPDAILMIDRSSAPHEGEGLLSVPAFAATPAAATGSLFKMDALYLLGFGPRTGQAARELASKLYPDLNLAAAK
ncbi:heme/hemin ABC transporter substrate-binding protein [Flaviflagellibacter deserti]|uniref:Hemin ABC transporter substrate-binding protein n=1 Tax=Flaviflagellibacter deserti TaxID=2267266 RepID=A0ABV9YZA6_9HYPH